MAGLRLNPVAGHALRDLPSASIAAPLASTCRPKGGRATPFASMILEAFKGMQRDILRCQTPWERLVRGATLSAILVREVSGLFSNVPYGIHAVSVYRSLKRASPAAESHSPEPAIADGSKPDPSQLSHRNPLQLLLSMVKLLLASWSTFLFSRSMPSAAAKGSHEHSSAVPREVILVQDIRYGPGERNTLDIYIPAPDSKVSWALEEDSALRQNGAQSGEALKPVLLFVHGGVWSSGDKWQRRFSDSAGDVSRQLLWLPVRFLPIQHAPMLVTCAREGVVVVAIQYTLYPDILSCAQADEVGRALTWTLDNIARYGGNPERVFLAGHSSGAHISALAIWERAVARLCQKAAAVAAAEESPGEAGSGTSTSQDGSYSIAAAGEQDLRQPYCFLGLSGVYDITSHLRHEIKRGVEAVSCMTPANGYSTPAFARRSPSILLAALAACAPGSRGLEAQQGEQSEEVGDYSKETRSRRAFAGEKSAAAVHAREALASSKADWHSFAPLLEHLSGAVCDGDEADGAEGDGRQEERSASALAAHISAASSKEEAREHVRKALQSSLFKKYSPGEGWLDGEGIAKALCSNQELFPPSVVTCSPADFVVPPDTSISYAAAMKSLGVPCTLLAYDNVDHGAFACWSLRWKRDALPPHVTDMLDILKGRQAVA